MNRRPDVMIVNASTNQTVYEKLAPNAAKEPPFLAAVAAGYLRQQGHGVELLDANVRGLTQEHTAEIIREADPKLVVIPTVGHQPSASHHIMGAIGDLCTEIKNTCDLPIVLTGNHPTALPRRTLTEEACDYVIVGEMYKPLDALLAGGESVDLTKIPGLHYFDDQKSYRQNPAAMLIGYQDKDLTPELGKVALDLLPDFDQYKTHSWHVFGENLERNNFGSLYTSLGCAYNCGFCNISIMENAAMLDNPKNGSAPTFTNDNDRSAAIAKQRTKMRTWNPEWAVDRIEEMTERGAYHIKFTDEMFFLDRPHVGAIMDGIIERGIKMNAWAYGRVDTIKNDVALLDKCKRAGLNWLCLGIESANAGVRDGADKKFGTHDIEKVVRTIERSGINVLGNYMVGLGNDTLETMQETYDLAAHLKTSWFNIYATMAYPGTQDHTDAIAKGFALPGDPGIPGGWTAYSHHAYNTLPKPTDTLTAGEVLRFRDNFYHNMCADTGYQEVVRDRFGEHVVDYLKKKEGGHIARRICGDPPAA